MKTFCKICNKTSHGNHFGVDSCRACAAFFRRTANSQNTSEACEKNEKNRKMCPCRPCRLRRCLKMGMVTENFQFNRDKYYLATRPSGIAPSIPHFVGRPEFLLFTDPLSRSSKKLIDVKKLILEASRLLDLGNGSLIVAKSYLKKLNLGFTLLQFDVDTMHYFDRLGRTECLDIIEFYFLTVTKWMMNFDEFNYLDRDVKLKIVKTVWFIWCKIHKCVATVRYRKLNKQAKPEHKILRNTCIDRKKVKVDTSWLSDYPHVYVSRCLLSQNLYDFEIMEALEKLSPTDVELTYMFAQLCFEYAGKHFQGEIQKATDHFQQILSNDLHGYYLEEHRNLRYIHRLNEILKVNNLVQRSIWESRPQRELGRFFNVLKIDFSHPEMFMDSGFY